MNPLLLKIAPYVGIAVLVFGLKHFYDSGIREDAVADERGRVATAYRDTLARSIALIRQAYRRDTILLTQRVTERVPVIKEVDKFIEKNVPVPVEVVKELIRVDSQAFEQCQIVKLTCQEENRLLKLDLQKSEDQTRAAKAELPSFKRQASTHTIAVVAGAVACFIWCPRKPE